jgi:hypothetical protein
MWGIYVGHLCGAFMWGIYVGHLCGAFMWGIYVGHLCGNVYSPFAGYDCPVERSLSLIFLRQFYLNQPDQLIFCLQLEVLYSVCYTL